MLDKKTSFLLHGSVRLRGSEKIIVREGGEGGDRLADRETDKQEREERDGETDSETREGREREKQRQWREEREKQTERDHSDRETDRYCAKKPAWGKRSKKSVEWHAESCHVESANNKQFHKFHKFINCSDGTERKKRH